MFDQPKEETMTNKPFKIGDRVGTYYRHDFGRDFLTGHVSRVGDKFIMFDLDAVSVGLTGHGIAGLDVRPADLVRIPVEDSTSSQDALPAETEGNQPIPCPDQSSDCRKPGCVHTVQGDIAKTNPDNVSERKRLGVLIAELAGDDYVTTSEAAEVVAWCQDWFADTYPDLAGTDTTMILRFCNRDIIGGLAFVLADVRRCR